MGQLDFQLPVFQFSSLPVLRWRVSLGEMAGTAWTEILMAVTM